MMKNKDKPIELYGPKRLLKELQKRGYMEKDLLGKAVTGMKNKPKHTPGPWNIGHYPECNTDQSYYDSAAAIEDNEVRANAALIAAAPDMYREIEETIVAIRECFKHLDANEYDDADSILEQTISDLKDVIKKAKGGE
jgi:hypothetical protein